MAGPVSNYDAEILAAMQLALDNQARYSKKMPGGEPYERPHAGDLDPAVDRYMRARAALAAQQSAQENEVVPEGGMRVTDPLDRSRYPGS